MRSCVQVHVRQIFRYASTDVREDSQQDGRDFLSPLVVNGVVCGVRNRNATAEDARRDLGLTFYGVAAVPRVWGDQWSQIER